MMGLHSGESVIAFTSDLHLGITTGLDTSVSTMASRERSAVTSGACPASFGMQASRFRAGYPARARCASCSRATCRSRDCRRS